MPPAKKAPGRHRHSPAQLAGLHELYQATTHPTLDQRIALAKSLGLETKSVNSYFQNKRASTKKRPRGVPYILASTPTSPLPDIDDEDYSPREMPSTQPLHPDFPAPSNQAMKLHPEQLEELQKRYALNAHPNANESQIIADSIGSQLQNVSNWFQNQNTLAEQQKAGGNYADPVAEEGDSSRAFPPAQDQPTLTERGRRSPSAFSVADDGFPSRSLRASSRRSSTPYGSTSAIPTLSARQRRARPEPLQLDALKQLFSKTPTPSIEERSALALEIGMEIGKVTNFFRNRRQSAKKRDKKLGRRHSGDSEDDLDYTDGYGTGFNTPSASASVSRSGTPSSSLERGDGRNGRLRPHMRLHSSDEFDDEEDEQDSAHEAVTPNQSQSPSPMSSPSHARILDFSVVAALHDAMMAMAHKDQKLAADALLLLEFQATCR
ncbi:hypothetical protein B0H15DRAFT_812493 [Mycena belliarum]|uniref:Homeobox domain-containing protein n=1 Tax=Mycena belliarum TaxID=1033014 RepID=A0AAD6UID3_9AGAR|nr:hypothetical protein B0H15DRAFT_812493 [Mycena belliae]